MTTRAAIASAVIACAACHRAPSIASCADNLGGVWRDGDDKRWMIVDVGDLEAYPLFDDGRGSGDLVVAPRVITLSRRDDPSAAHAEIVGEVHRRSMSRADQCEGHHPARLTRCDRDGLELVLADPGEPLTFGPCSWSQAVTSRVERWHRE